MKGAGLRNLDPVFKTTGWGGWAEPRDSSSAWYFTFFNGSEDWDRRGFSYVKRVFGVRLRPN